MDYAETAGEKFVRQVVADRESYILNAKSKDGLYQFEYKIQKSDSIKELENIEKGIVEIPKWIIAMACGAMIFALTFFIASLVLMSNEKPDAGYLQSCADRQCSKDLNIKCINKTCKCESPKFYKKKCVDFSKYGENCVLTSECDSSQILSCIGSKCICSFNKYWNSEANICVDKLNFGETCSANQCKINVNLICNSGVCDCIDNTLYYWSNSDNACLPKKRYVQTCMLNNDCLNSEKTLCINGYCLCPDNQYFSVSECTDRLDELVSCSHDIMCKMPMTCQSNECKCYGYYFYDKNIQNCVDMIANETGVCELAHHCRTDFNLECNTGLKICKCKSDYTWSNIQSKCKLTNNQGCSNNDECNRSEGLTCISSKCECIRTITNETYWDVSLCSPSKSYNTSCSSDIQCKTLSELTKCIGGFCECESPGGWSSISSKCKLCSANDYFFNEICYYISSKSEKGKDADNRCDDFKTSANVKYILAKIDSQDIIDFLIDETGAGEYWVSGKDDKGKYVYHDNKNIQIDNSLCNKFENGGEKCLNFKHDGNTGCYNTDLKCDDGNVKRPYICQY